MRKFGFPLFIFLAILAVHEPLYADSANDGSPRLKRKLGVGFAYTGGLLRYGFLKHWSAEFRYLIGSDGGVSSSVIGARGYRHFMTDKKLQLYTGVDFAYATARDSNSSFKTKGYVLGGFGGVEYYILRRLSIGLDLGPYYTTLKEATTSTKGSGFDFILNTSLNFYIF